MEESKEIDLSKRPKEERNVDPSCPFLWFGDEQSADNDLKEKFVIKEDHEEVNHK